MSTENNKLKDEVNNILIDADNPSDGLYTLIEDVSVKFADWNDSNSYTEFSELLKMHDFNYKDLFTYFINNIYNK